MRLVLVGGGSFIARHMFRAAQKAGLDAVPLPHDADLASALKSSDVVVNFALDPAYFSGPYSEETDCDLRAARQAKNAGARITMLSTRRVYTAATRWGARETEAAVGDETFYGRNKARSEASILDLFEGRVAIFRLSNVFGFEHEPGRSRRTFFAQMLRSLKTENVIRFDMHPDTRRDFVPVEVCVNAILQRAADGTEDVLNLGCGFPVRCGDLAQWVLEGYGQGELIVDPPVVKDEFFLNMDQWRLRFPGTIDPDGLRDYCQEIGRRLQLTRS